MAGFSGKGDKPLGSMKTDFLEWLYNYQLLKKDTIP
jgi:hypothetical protein